MEYLKKYEEWCENPFFDKETKEELIKIKNNEEEIKDRFYKDLEFGTAGLRGIIGAGTNRMNKYTVTKATQGLANFIKKEKKENQGVAIGFDSRHMSKEFSDMAALCLNANGIKTYVFDSLRPAPEISFAVRELGCVAGIVITASHNPPEYNGYKVYWEDGAQITAPKDKLIIEEVKKVMDYSEAKSMKKEEAVKEGLYFNIGKDVDDRYIEEIKKLVLNPDIIREKGKELKIVYTPLHGTGNVPVNRILKELGFKNVYVVPEQEQPDGNFPTVEYPNPEDSKAFKLALNLAKEKNADIVLATDPDADRLGVYAKDKKSGEYIPFTGNMSGMLIAEYILSQRKEKGILPKNAALIKTIVSTNMADAITEEYDIKLIEVLTGFKYIGEQIKLFEKNKNYEYVFGFEESYGCLAGTHARDKDAVVAVMLLCEAAAYYMSKNMTLWDEMIEMYEKYGYYKEGLISITMSGAEGAEKIKQLLNDIRNNPPKELGKYKVTAFSDYNSSIKNDFISGKQKEIELPKSNVLYFDLEENSWCCVRPSGTEPKVKFYMGVKGSSIEDAQNKLDELTEAMRKIANQ